MDQNNIEFLIDDVVAEADSCRLQGVCNVGPINLGDVFGLTYRPIREYSEDGFIEFREFSESVVLEVVEIVAYRKSLDELSEGMSGELKVMGAGLNKLQSRNMLVK